VLKQPTYGFYHFRRADVTIELDVLGNLVGRVGLTYVGRRNPVGFGSRSLQRQPALDESRAKGIGFFLRWGRRCSQRVRPLGS
jgi:hypothetical protein